MSKLNIKLIMVLLGLAVVLGYMGPEPELSGEYENTRHHLSVEAERCETNAAQYGCIGY